jgi:hypothetical protein
MGFFSLVEDNFFRRIQNPARPDPARLRIDPQKVEKSGILVEKPYFRVRLVSLVTI